MGKENTSKHAFHTIEKFRVNTWHYVGMKATTNVLCCIWQGKPPIKSNIYCSLWNGDQTPHSTCCLVNSIQYYCMYYDMLYHLNLGALDLVLVPFHLILYACIDSSVKFQKKLVLIFLGYIWFEERNKKWKKRYFN